ncbi:MAG: glycosyltransferase family 39 protein [Proteobacteria bacterium]|nr:glycosyltransferase family 39 protein [Pseudomonadota bacterium]
MITQNTRTHIAAIALVALAVRVWGTNFGLPYDFTADEPHQIVQALKIGAGEGGPLVQMWHTIGKGGLDYLLFIEYGVLFCVLWLFGKVQSAQDFAFLYLSDPSVFYQVGRITIASMGALTCIAVYGVGRRMFARRTALFAALIGALALDHVTNSHLINVHIPMACALWLAVWCYVEYEHRPRSALLWASGALAGIAISLAYNAVVGLAMLAVALLTSSAPARHGLHRRTALLRLLGGGLVTVLLLAPELLTSGAALLENFRQVLGDSAATPALDHDSPRAAIDAVTILRAQGWSEYLPILLGWRYLPVTLAALAGGVAGILRRERWTLLLTGGIVVLVMLLSASDRGASERYMLPMTPAFWLVAARGVTALSGRRAWLAALLMVAVTAPNAYHIIRMDYTLTRPDSRVLAKQWIESHVPAGARLLVDGMRFRYIQSPPLKPAPAALERQIAALQGSELKYPKRFIELYRSAKSSLPGPAYDLYSTMYGLEVRELDYYVSACFDYIITSSDITDRYAAGPLRVQYAQTARFYDALRTHPAFREVYRASGEPWRTTGPTITVYRVASACGSPAQPATVTPSP